MVFNSTFNNISVILWLSVLLVKGTGVPGENHQPDVSLWQTLSPIVSNVRKLFLYHQYRMKSFCNLKNFIWKFCLLKKKKRI